MDKTKAYGGGFIFFKIINFISYTVLGISFIVMFDIIIGTIMVILLASIRSILLIWLYDKGQKDIFKIEKRRLQAYQEVAVGSKKSRIKKILLFIFFILWDPAITIISYRSGSFLFNGIPTKELKIIFILSSILSTIVWLLILKIVEPLILKFVWPYIWPIIREIIVFYYTNHLY